MAGRGTDRTAIPPGRRPEPAQRRRLHRSPERKPHPTCRGNRPCRSRVACRRWSPCPTPGQRWARSPPATRSGPPTRRGTRHASSEIPEGFGALRSEPGGPHERIDATVDTPQSAIAGGNIHRGVGGLRLCPVAARGRAERIRRGHLKHGESPQRAGLGVERRIARCEGWLIAVEQIPAGSENAAEHPAADGMLLRQEHRF